MHVRLCEHLVATNQSMLNFVGWKDFFTVKAELNAVVGFGLCNPRIAQRTA